MNIETLKLMPKIYNSREREKIYNEIFSHDAILMVVAFNHFLSETSQTNGPVMGGLPFTVLNTKNLIYHV